MDPAPSTKASSSKLPFSGKPRTELLPGDWAGLILICDIVNFSHLNRPAQAAAVDRLWCFVSDPKWEQSLGKQRLINGTGDGFMIACPRSDQLSHEGFIHFAEEMVRHMARNRPRRLGLRVGIHQGAFDVLKLWLASGKNFRQGLGQGINRCARIVALGDDGDITVSENFIGEWSDNSQKRVRDDFSPRPPKPPFEVVVKHGETLPIRFYRPGRRVERPWPVKIKVFNTAAKEIHRQLQFLADATVEYLTQLDPTLTAESIDIRVSIFAEGRLDDGTPVLLPTPFRDFLDRGGQPGATFYRIARPGAGPVGRAYVGRKFEIWHRLPDSRTNARAYCRELEKSGLDAATIKGFGRNARAFVAIPFGLLSGRPDGVVCIDAMSPLDNIAAKHLHEMAFFLKEQFNTALTALWRLRGQL